MAEVPEGIVPAMGTNDGSSEEDDVPVNDLTVTKDEFRLYWIGAFQSEPNLPALLATPMGTMLLLALVDRRDSNQILRSVIYYGRVTGY